MLDSTTPPHILIVDDSQTAQKFLARVITTRLDYPVRTVASVDAAIEVLQEVEVGLVILDHNLKDEEGFDFMARKRQNPTWQDIPVLVVTGSEYEDELVARYIEVGAVDFLLKKLNIPVMMARMLQCLRSYIAAKEKQSLLVRLEATQQKNTELLKNTLPVSVYNEILAEGEFKARVFDDASIIFADVCNFTQFTNLHSTAKLVDNLNALVRRMEEICDRYDLCKIKTIGDAFMAVGGVLDYKADVSSTLQAAEEMVRAVIELDMSWQVRVGVASGSLVGGIVGDQRMQFDVWGSSVNLAARMCSCAQPNTVAVPRALLPMDIGPERLQDVVGINVKGFGEVEVAIFVPTEVTVPEMAVGQS